MANIKLRRGSGVPSGLTFGEPAFDITNSRLYVGITGGSALVGVAGGGVHSFNGLTGAVTGVTTGTANTFGPLQSFTTGISASGGTFSTYLGALNFRAIRVGGDEGGQIEFDLPATSTSLTGGVAMDIYQNRVRIFETGGTNRGVFIDLTGVSAGVGTNLIGGGGGGAVSSVSGSGSGISVSPTTGAVVVQNTGVHSFNGLTGAVTGVTTGTANTFDLVQNFTSGISTSGITVGNSRMTSTTFNGINGFTIRGSTAGAAVAHNEIAMPLASSPLTISSATGVINLDSGLASKSVDYNTAVRFFGYNTGLGTSTNTTLVAGGGAGNTLTLPTQTGTLLVSSEAVTRFNGLTGSVTGVTTGNANTFGPLQSFTNGISSAGGTFGALTRFTSGICASGGVTFSGTLSGFTATFNGLIISTAGFSGTGITLSGNLSAATKSFLIPHPIQPNKKLQYACLEGPENGVYVRGRLTESNVIDLPDYWTALVHSDSITVQLTANGSQKNYFVKSIEENRIIVGSKSKDIDCFYLVQAERKDVPKLTVEY